MPHNPTAINPWTTAQQFNSGEGSTSTQYNQLVNNLSLMYARPWMQVAATASTSTANGGALFVPGSSPATTSNSPASLYGSITFGAVGSNYGFTIPAGLQGMFRITMCVSVASQATGITYGMIATGVGGATANNWSYSCRAPSSTAVATSAQFSFLVPMSGTGTTGAYPTQVNFTFLTTSTVATSVSTPPSYTNGTYAQIEYLGASTGSI
jgi:hypothetical protein